MKRIDKANYYLDIAESVLERDTCLKRRQGAIIVSRDEIIATGYAGAPRGRKNCCDIGRCARMEQNIPAGTRYEMCRSVHAEQNAIISARRADMIGSTMYLVRKETNSGEYVPNSEPCSICKRLIINAGIEKVVIRRDKTKYDIIDVQKDYIENDETLDN
jgi:dCMP deaminase